jgi:hypothetical protein
VKNLLHKILSLGILLFSLWSLSHAAFFDRPYYTRDQIPLFVTDSGTFITVSFDGKPFKPFDDSASIALTPVPDAGEGLKKAYIPLGFNAPRGVYTVLVDGNESLRYHFLVTARSPRPLQEPLFMWSVENGGRYDRLEGDYLRDPSFSPGNIDRWMERVGFNALYFMIGQTNSSLNSVNGENPWIPGPLNTWEDFSVQRKARYKGGYIGSYLSFGDGNRKLKQYRFSKDFDDERKIIFTNKFISITDSRREADIMALAQRLDDNDDIDFVGLDYIRMGPGGFEHFREFADIFGITLPQGTEEEQMYYVGSHVRLGTIPEFKEKWRYFRAFKTAQVIRRISEAIRKPLFVFTLGWEQGHSHGQDPVMFSDAGADVIMVMFYEATHSEHDRMMESWQDYLREAGPLQILAGQDVDVVLNDAEDPARQGPEEMLRRYEENIRVLSRRGQMRGFFLHDLVRTFNGRILPHYSEEWLFAAGTVRQRFLEECGTARVLSSVKEKKNGFVWSLYNKSDKKILIMSMDIFPGPRDSFCLDGEEIPPKGTLEIHLPYRYSNKRLKRNYVSVYALLSDGSRITDMLYYPVP